MGAVAGPSRVYREVVNIGGPPNVDWQAGVSY